MPEITGKGNAHRLAVIVSSKTGEQLLGVPKIENGTGEETSKTVISELEEWDLTKNVQAVCCDTTSSNTGRNNGACRLIEKKLGRDLLWLPCRHHMYEVILRAAFEVKMGGTSAPNVLLFKRFQQEWCMFLLKK